MRKHYLLLVIGLIITNAATYRFASSAKADISQAEYDLKGLKRNYDRQIISLGSELARNQHGLGHATYFVIGLPSEDPVFEGFPACYLGCVDLTMNGVNARRTFIEAYNSKLDSLIKTNQGQQKDEPDRRNTAGGGTGQR